MRCIEKHGQTVRVLRIFTCIFIVLDMVPIIGSAQSRSANPEVSVQLSIGKNRFRIGEVIEVKLEIVNVGKTPFLIGNGILLNHSGPISHLDLTLKDAHGAESPKMLFNADSFGIRPAKPAAQAALDGWLLLRSNCSFGKTFILSEEVFSFLHKPGRYELSGVYLSRSIADKEAYLAVGLSDADVAAVNFPSWSGKLQTNTLEFEILAH